MKKLSSLLLFGLLAVLVACDKNEETETRFSHPEAVVSGTSVTLTCYTNFAESVLLQSESGFMYQAIEPAGNPVYVAASRVSGNAITGTISNLAPQTVYRVQAYLKVGDQYLLGTPSAFVTEGDGGTDNPDPEPGEVVPTFGTLIASDVTATSATLNCQYAYDGDATGIAVYFRYKMASASTYTTVSVSTAEGMKTAPLSGLTAATTYEAALCFTANGKTYTSNAASFTTLTEQGGGGTNPGLTKYSGWAELPVEVKNSDYHYASHICPDFFVGGRLARNYTVCFSAENHCPVWVAAPRHACYESGADRTDAYTTDPMISSSIQYKSRSTGGGCNKGHMLGSAERLATTATNKQVFYYTNIAPQYSSSFNTGGGAWNNLENFIDGQVCADTTYVVIGTYFKPYTDAYGQSCSPATIDFGGRSDVTRPSMFYYLVLRTKTGKTGKSVANCSASELKCAAFVLRHNMEKGHTPQAKDMLSVADLEQLTGFQFFTNVPNAPKTTYTASDWGL